MAAGQVPTNHAAAVFEIFKQGAALGAVLGMPFERGSRHGVEFAVEVSLRS
jgi:hypothetical protein